MTVDRDRTADAWLELVLDLEDRVRHFAGTDDEYAELEAELWERVQESTRLVDIGHRGQEKAWPRICQYSMASGYRDADPDAPGALRESIRCLDSSMARRKQLLPPLKGGVR